VYAENCLFLQRSKNKIYTIIGTHTQLWGLHIKDSSASKILKCDFCIFKYLLLLLYGPFHMLYSLHNHNITQYHTSNKRCFDSCVAILIPRPNGYVMHQQV